MWRRSVKTMTVHCLAKRTRKAKVPRKDSQIMKTCARRSWDDSAVRRFYFGLGKDCLTRAIVAHGSPRRRESRCIKFCTVYWFAAFKPLNSDQSIGTDTGAPARARVE